MVTQKWWHHRSRKCIYPHQYHDLIPFNRTFIHRPAPAFHRTPIRITHRWPIQPAWMQRPNMISHTIHRTYTVRLAVICIQTIYRNRVTVTMWSRNQMPPTTITWTTAYRAAISVVRLHHHRCIRHRIWPVIIISIMSYKRLNWWHRLEDAECCKLYEIPPIDFCWILRRRCDEGCWIIWKMNFF